MSFDFEEAGFQCSLLHHFLTVVRELLVAVAKNILKFIFVKKSLFSNYMEQEMQFLLHHLNSIPTLWKAG